MLSLFFWFSELIGDNIVWGTSEEQIEQSTSAILESKARAR